MLVVAVFFGSAANAGTIAPGDLSIRHDIQVLADYGVITGPVSTWPLDWRAIAADIHAARDLADMPTAVSHSLYRVEQRLQTSLRSDKAFFSAGISFAEDPARIRSFRNTPREDAELSAGVRWTNDRLVVDLNVQGVESPADGEDFRADGSLLGINLGNFTIAASTMERWWGPGWDGSLILSNNARPIPSLTINRAETTPFRSKWLSWIGPWDVSLIWGQLEDERFVPNARFFGFRLNFRPIESLEIGLSRTAQWCGAGRPCGFDAFTDLLTGNDNVGDEGITRENEPGNQLAGMDMRWTTRRFGTPISAYAQFTGEDEAGGFPSRYLASGGLEISGVSENGLWSYRWFAEVAGTSCDFVKDDLFDCAYNHSIYQSGYRYRGRSIGHAAENDALTTSIGVFVAGRDSSQFGAVLRAGDLNRGGSPDPDNTLTPVALDLLSVDLTYSREFGGGRIEFGAGIEDLENIAAGTTSTDFRAYLSWNSNEL